MRYDVTIKWFKINHGRRDGNMMVVGTEHHSVEEWEQADIIGENGKDKYCAVGYLIETKQPKRTFWRKK
jgi:hypothetical protein